MYVSVSHISSVQGSVSYGITKDVVGQRGSLMKENRGSVMLVK